MSFEANFDTLVYGVPVEKLDVQKVFELENALPDLPFEDQLGDMKAQAAAGIADQLMTDSHSPNPQQVPIPQEASASSSLPRTISMEMDTLKSDEENLVIDPTSEAQSEDQEPDSPKATPTLAETTPSSDDNTSVVHPGGAAEVQSTSRESLITNVMTTMQTFASTVDGLDQDQLAAIEGIALLSEVAERKAIATRAEFWNCVAGK